MLAMLAVTALFNILLLQQMPDGSARSMGPAKRQGGSTPARRLGGQEGQAGAGSSTGRGMLKRWVLRSTAKSSSGAPDNERQSAAATQQGRGSMQNHLSHPHFSDLSPVTEGRQQVALSRPHVETEAEEITTADLGDRAQEASELEEVFGRRQDREARHSQLGSLLPVSSGPGRTDAPPAQQQGQQQVPELGMDKAPHARVDPAGMRRACILAVACPLCVGDSASHAQAPILYKAPQLLLGGSNMSCQQWHFCVLCCRGGAAALGIALTTCR